MLVASLFIALLIILFFSFKNWIKNKQEENNCVYPTTLNDFKNGNKDFTQISGDPISGIEVTAVYEKEKSQNQIFFKLYFNTHAAEYSNYDFRENIAIKDSQGKVYKAVNIAKEGAEHHQSVEVAFPLAVSLFKLIAKNLAGVADRIFSW